jgi:hypothetical protein
MPGFKLVEGAHYFCDNGACYCSAHLGYSAKTTGRDISGQKIHRVTKAEMAELETILRGRPACESCRVARK